MTGAMYASIAGLKTHMQTRNVIGNNVANVNTNGYKSQRTVFQDSIYSQYSSGANGTATRAGQNPSQIGYGVRISTIDLNMTTGSFNPGMPTDCMLDGDGFFLVGQKDVANTISAENPNSFKSLTLTRVGNFEFKEDGYFANQNGDAVYGFQVVGYDTEGKPIVSDQLVTIRLPEYEMVEVPKLDDKGQPMQDADGKPITTTEYVLRWPVAATDTAGTNPNPTTGVNSDGVVVGEQLKSVTGVQGPLQNYSEYIDSKPANPGGGNGGTGTTEPKRDFGIAKLESISVSPTGAITGIVGETKEQITIGYLAIGNPTNPNGLTHDGGHYYTCRDGAGDLGITTIGGVAKELSRVGGGGVEYVNGGQVNTAGAGGANPPAGTDTSLSDILSAKAAVGALGKTTLYAGFLEGSNADLATEISELITTQRGYQANTRIVTVTDSMLEELVNMKR